MSRVQQWRPSHRLWKRTMRMNMQILSWKAPQGSVVDLIRVLVRVWRVGPIRKAPDEEGLDCFLVAVGADQACSPNGFLP